MKNRQGFTLIEVGLFLAITGLLLVGIIAGTSNSVSRQRYTDSVQSFAEFLRGIYSKVSDPQGVGDGRSEKAIYGKLVNFGETLNLTGNPNSDGSIFIYDVIGDVAGTISGNDVLRTLSDLNANVVIKDGDKLVPAGLAESYIPKWRTSIETTADAKTTFKNSILIVRSPLSGTIYTYILNTNSNQNPIEVNQIVKIHSSSNINPLKSHLNQSEPVHFVSQDIDFCLSPDGNIYYGGARHNIRLSANAHNSSGVEIVPLDSHTLPNGNRCKKLQ